jgi:hypothetical protein
MTEGFDVFKNLVDFVGIRQFSIENIKEKGRLKLAEHVRL